ncbi:MAG: tyrosine-type recombinase/integrase [Candidatus Acidiferrales bacterium]
MDGKKVRKQAAKRLAPFCDRYRTIKSVRPLADDILRPVNSERESSGSRTLQSFIELHYLPYTKEHKKPSTYKGYENIYRLHVQSRVAGIRVQDYRTVDTQKLLDAIATDKPGISHTTLLHIKGFLSGVFSVAKRLGAYDGENPVRDTAVPKGVAAQDTHAYSLHEIESMIDALKDETHRTAVIVAAFTGLALSELRGLRFSDVGEDRINVHTSYWRTHEGETKTKARAAAIPLLPVVAQAVAEHRERNPRSEFVFEGLHGRPLDLATMGSKKIKPALAENDIEWHAWHAFRRGLATNLHELGVQDKTIQAILRHSNVAVTQAAYIKQLPAASIKAMRRLGEKWKAKS